MNPAELQASIGRDVTLFVLRSDGYSRPVQCRPLSNTDPLGPVVLWRGERIRLRGWRSIIGVRSTLRRRAA